MEGIATLRRQVMGLRKKVNDLQRIIFYLLSRPAGSGTSNTFLLDTYLTMRATNLTGMSFGVVQSNLNGDMGIYAYTSVSHTDDGVRYIRDSVGNTFEIQR